MTKTEEYIKELKKMGFVQVQDTPKKFKAFQHPQFSKLIVMTETEDVQLIVGCWIDSPDQFLAGLKQYLYWSNEMAMMTS